MDQNARDVVGMILQSGTGLAGVLLVFAGFMFTKAESAGTAKRQFRYALAARAALIPVACCLICVWMALDYLNGSNPQLYSAVISLFRASILTTFLYSASVLIFYL